MNYNTSNRGGSKAAPNPADNGAEIAANAAKRGWTVVKIKPGKKRAAELWRDLPWRDPETIRRIFSNGRYAVGILTEKSGLVCDDLDVDDEGNPAGEWSLEDLADGDWDKIPRTFEVATPSGGRHLIWKAPNGREFKTCAGQMAPHIDVRGRGGLFVLWDPTRAYQVIDDYDPAEMPSWLAELHPEPGARMNGQIRYVDSNGAREWLEKHGGGQPCETMAKTRDKWLDALDKGLPHDAMTNGVYALIGDRALGHTGLSSALAELRAAFRDAVSGRKREREWLVDWRNAIATAIAKKAGRVSDNDPCAELAGLKKHNSARRKRDAALLARIRDGEWLDEQQFAPLRFAVPDLLPEGLVLLVGSPKVGKSTIIRRIGLECARGGYVFGIKCEAEDVLYIALEDDDPSMQASCWELLGEDAIPKRFKYITEIDPGKLIQTVGAWLMTVPRGMVCVDTLGRAMEPAQRGESTYDRDYRIMTMLKSVAKLHPGSTIVVTHHDRKGKADDWVNTVSGTNAIAGAADTIISLTRQRGNGNGIWRSTSRKPMDDAEYALLLERPYGWRLDGDDLLEATENANKARTSHRSDMTNEIIAFVNDNGDVTRGQVAKEFDISPNYAGVYLSRCEKRGDIKLIRRGHYGPVGKLRAGGGGDKDE